MAATEEESAGGVRRQSNLVFCPLRSPYLQIHIGSVSCSLSSPRVVSSAFDLLQNYLQRWSLMWKFLQDRDFVLVSGTNKLFLCQCLNEVSLVTRFGQGLPTRDQFTSPLANKVVGVDEFDALCLTVNANFLKGK